MDGAEQVLAAERLRIVAETTRQKQESLREAQELTRASAELARAVAEECRLAAVKEVSDAVVTLRALLERMEAVEKMRRASRNTGAPG